MTCGLVHASYSFPEWQAVKAECILIFLQIFFQDCQSMIVSRGEKFVQNCPLDPRGLTLMSLRTEEVGPEFFRAQLTKALCDLV